MALGGCILGSMLVCVTCGMLVLCRGWGLRTLDDIPKGSFVCTYIGHIYTEQGGEEVGCYTDGENATCNPNSQYSTPYTMEMSTLPTWITLVSIIPPSSLSTHPHPSTHALHTSPPLPSEVMEHHKEGYESDVEGMSVCSSSSSEQGSTYSIESASSMRVHLKKLPSVTHPTETDIMASLPSSTVTTPKSTRLS